MKRGDVYLANLAPRSGSEEQGKRPVVVMSHDAFNQVTGWRSVIVVPVSTSARQAARGPTAITLRKGAGGLTKDSVAICHQVTTLDRRKLTHRLGKLTRAELAAIEEGVKAAMDLV